MQYLSAVLSLLTVLTARIADAWSINRYYESTCANYMSNIVITSRNYYNLYPSRPVNCPYDVKAYSNRPQQNLLDMVTLSAVMIGPIQCSRIVDVINAYDGLICKMVRANAQHSILCCTFYFNIGFDQPQKIDDDQHDGDSLAVKHTSGEWTWYC